MHSYLPNVPPSLHLYLQNLHRENWYLVIRFLKLTRLRSKVWVKTLRESIAKDDREAIAAQTEELKQALYALSSSVYQQGGGEAPSGAAPEDSTKDAASTGWLK